MKLRVVNDTAERGVKLFQDYNLVLSRDEKETQLILRLLKLIEKLYRYQNK